MDTQFTSLNGNRFFLQSWGARDKPLLLMLHGFPEYSGGWSDLAPFLEHAFHCIAPDQRGYGQSWAPKGTSCYRLSNLISDMAALIETYGSRAWVLGHDWGASVAYGLAMSRPDLVARLIVANGVHPVPFQRAMAAGTAQSKASQYINALRAPDAADHFSADNFHRLERFFRHGMGLDWLTDDRLAQYRTEWARPGRLEAMLNWYRASPLVVAEPGKPRTNLPKMPTDRLRIHCPHLLLWGPDDRALLPESTEGLETFAPDLTRITIPGTDHWLHHQRPQDVARAILTWARSS